MAFAWPIQRHGFEHVASVTETIVMGAGRMFSPMTSIRLRNIEPSQAG
ncbi:hypothetical protein [Novipirellula galeiformis]|nr:hypothetical protein [Novipirellula galeiformis]